MAWARRRWVAHASIIAIYIVLSLLLTWPLARHFSTHVPGNGGDDPALTWNLWWVKYALIDLGTNPFDCRYMFHPLGINLAFYTLTVLNGVISIPLQGTLGLAATSNLLLLSSFVLGAYGAYLLARDVLSIHLPTLAPRAAEAGAAFAGLAYGFSSSKLYYASLGQFNIASSQWIPFYILMLWRMGREPGRWRYPVVAGLFLLMQGWAEMTYASFLLVFTALFVVWSLARGRGWPFLRALAVLAVIFALGMAPIVAQMLPDMLSEGDFFVEGTGFAEEYSSDPLGFLVPTSLHPWLGGIVESLDFPHTLAQHYYLGYSFLALALLGLIAGWRRPAVRFWCLSATTFALLTLGPTLHINGRDVGLPLPFRLFQVLPFFKGNRYPSRYGVLLVLSLAILAGMGLAWAWTRLATRWRWHGLLAAGGGILSAIFVLEHLSVPLPLSDMRIPPAYEAISEPGDYAILDLPMAWRNGFRVTGVMDPIFMYAQFYQTEHHKRLLGGNTSRNPEQKFQYFTEAPVLNSIIALERGHVVDDATRAADKRAAPAVLRFFDIRYVVVHVPTAGPELLAYVESTFPLALIHQDDAYRVYRVTGIDSPGAGLDGASLDDPVGRLTLAEGWGVPMDGSVWAQARRARALVNMSSDGGTLAITLRAPGEARISVSVNHCPVGEAHVGSEWRAYELDVLAECIDITTSDVWLEAGSPFSIDVARSPESMRAIGETGVTAPVEITVRSAGKEVGDFGHIYVDGTDRSPGERGYNLVALDPGSGALLAAEAFDTHIDAGESGRLASFVDDLPAGSIVALAAMDTVSDNLSEDAVRALGTLGLEGDLRGRFRWSHAAVGVKGAPPGSASEALSENMPATVVVGNGGTREGLYFELGALEYRSRSL